jgi:hypothetical protein
VENQVGKDEQHDSHDIGRPGVDRCLERILAVRFGFGREVFRNGHRERGGESGDAAGQGDELGVLQRERKAGQCARELHQCVVEA